MNDRIFAFTFIVIAFFVLGFTISRAVFKSPAPSADSTLDTATIAQQTAEEITEDELLLDAEKNVAEQGEAATTTDQMEEPAQLAQDVITVTIKNTPTGWLNVREGPGITYLQVKRVNPGETYTLLEEKFGWYKIKLDAKSEGTSPEPIEGWIASQYATKSQSQ